MSLLFFEDGFIVLGKRENRKISSIELHESVIRIDIVVFMLNLKRFDRTRKIGYYKKLVTRH